jgi:tellurite resistance protein TerA
MSIALSKGQKTDLTKTNPGLTRVFIGLGWKVNQAGDSFDIDGAAFLLGANGKCPREEDFVFYGNPSGRQGAVVHSTGKSGTADAGQVVVDFNKVPQDIDKISFTITIYDADKRSQNFGLVSELYVRVMNQDGLEIVRFNPGRFTVETAIVAAELYRYKGEWKFNAVGSGYMGGLAALCGDFGIDVAAQQETPAPKVESKPVPPAVPPAAPPAAKVKLAKIELKKKGDVISLEKKPNQKLGEIRVNLNWSQRAGKSGGFFGKLAGDKKIDLDVGCLYELKSGQKGVVQALGNAFGSLQQPPYIKLDQDDRSGTVAGGENLTINGDKVVEFRRVLVYAFIYEGVPNWAQADGVVTIYQPGGPDIVVKMDEHSGSKRMCAIALFENQNNETFSIQRLVQYFSGHREMDKEYGWNMRWVAGSK